jgi:hypothetical protein
MKFMNAKVMLITQIFIKSHNVQDIRANLSIG